MIDLTRLNGTRLVLNCDLIKCVEASPDTTMTLITGEKLVVLETLDELIARVAQYRSRLFAAAWPSSAQAASVLSIAPR